MKEKRYSLAAITLLCLFYLTPSSAVARTKVEPSQMAIGQIVELTFEFEGQRHVTEGMVTALPDSGLVSIKSPRGNSENLAPSLVREIYLIEPKPLGPPGEQVEVTLGQEITFLFDYEIGVPMTTQRTGYVNALNKNGAGFVEVIDLTSGERYLFSADVPEKVRITSSSLHFERSPRRPSACDLLRKMRSI